MNLISMDACNAKFDYFNEKNEKLTNKCLNGSDKAFKMILCYFFSYSMKSFSALFKVSLKPLLQYPIKNAFLNLFYSVIYDYSSVLTINYKVNSACDHCYIN